MLAFPRSTAASFSRHTPPPVESGATLNLESMFLHGTENDDKCTERYDAQGLWAKGPLVEVCSDGILNLNNVSLRI